MEATLLNEVTRPRRADRTAGHQRADAEWLAEVLTDLEVDEVARLHMMETLRRVVG